MTAAAVRLVGLTLIEQRDLSALFADHRHVVEAHAAIVLLVFPPAFPTLNPVRMDVIRQLANHAITWGVLLRLDVPQRNVVCEH